MKNLKFIQYGFGPIGKKVASYALDRGLKLEAVIDSDPEKIGKDAEYLGKKFGEKIRDRAFDIFQGSKSKVVFLTTSSSLEEIHSQIVECIFHKKNIVSTCEELSFPWKQHPDISRSIDDMAKEYGVSVIGTGVNPGFAMDALPAFLTSVCKDVESVKVERYQDASKRRLPFQEKIGAGLSEEEFYESVKDNNIRHVGFTESVQMIAYSLGWELTEIEETIAPVITKKKIRSEDLTVKKGNVCGIKQVCKGYINGKEVITLDLQAFFGHKDPHDSVTIKGKPNITSVIKGGIDGDIATCAMTVNCTKKIIEAEPGLRTMLDIGLTSWYEK